MPDREKILRLACAASYLCSAHDELLSAGFSGWSTELQHLMEIISAEMAWLERAPSVSLLPPKP